KKMATQFGATLHSLVFPRNQWNPDYLFSCQERGITQLRSNPDAWYWKDTSQSTLATKLFRTGDAYLPLGSTSYPMEKVTIDFVTAQPASRFLRPHHRLSFLNSLRLQRIKNEMLQAAKQGEVYHLWWHPHNFGNHPTESMVVLHEIASWFTLLHEKYGMESVPMKDLTSANQ
ncbi:MAG TPA: polysaccharide deacetylase, partial [Flavobacterium sp.]|nr:polysaccharide deacetylase [Flavobacterium sp.]